MRKLSQNSVAVGGQRPVRLGGPFRVRLSIPSQRDTLRLIMIQRGDLLFLDEVTEIARVSTDTVRFWVRQGKLASLRPGRRRLVTRSALETFLRQSMKATSDTGASR
jgi:excisionase family DNA binding protein